MRVTQSMIHNDLVLTLNRQKNSLEKVENEISTGVKIQKPSDDPVGAANQNILSSRLNEINQYERNAGDARDKINLIDGNLGQVTDIMQRVRELAVQAANGTNSKFELSEPIAREIEQHLLALVDIANGKDSTGKTLFGGSVIERNSFVAVYSNNVTDGNLDNGRALSGVVYQGDILTQKREIERGQQMDITVPGNRVFWGTNMTIASNTDASNYVARGNESFAIDGVKIDVAAGDTLNEIIRKINNSPVDVKASIGAQNDLVLTTKSPHQMWLEDVEGSTVLQDLGVIDGNNPAPGNNISASALVTGMSMFDVIIQLRDDLIRGDQNQIGGRDMEAIDMAMDNVLRYRSDVGARENRLETHEKKLASDKIYTQDLLAKNQDVDMVDSIVQLKWLESIHGYALKVGADLIKPTLMDFLR
ncbi:MAG: flagellar hook-associated protein 3 [Spirochaetia bacterium]|nr:flagellar hook-associated protein 3 [Spirochaetia bacterium]